ncbi:NADP-dependent oxidoreductase domain-containing protein [Sparassis latifolia]
MPQLGLGVSGAEDCSTSTPRANEAEVGKAVRESSIPREDIFVTSKVMVHEHGYNAALSAIDDSLQRFGLGYLDLFLIHSVLSGKEKRLETGGHSCAKKAGKFRVYRLEEIREAGLEMPVVNQVEPIVDYCTAHNIVVQAYCPFIRGKNFDEAVLTEVAKKYAKSVPQILVRWSLQRGYSSQPARIAVNAEVYDFEIAGEDMDALDALDRARRVR